MKPEDNDKFNVVRMNLQSTNLFSSIMTLSTTPLMRCTGVVTTRNFILILFFSAFEIGCSAGFGKKKLCSSAENEKGRDDKSLGREGPLQGSFELTMEQDVYKCRCAEKKGHKNKCIIDRRNRNS